MEEQIPVEIYKGKAKKNYKSVGVQNPSNVKRRVLKSMATKRTSFKWSKCDCEKEFIPGIVLDPFIGSGTTALVALKQNKNFIGFELNKGYIKIAKKRIKPFMIQQKLRDVK